MLVMFCVNIISVGFQRVFVLPGVVLTCFHYSVWPLLRVKEIMIYECLFLKFLLLLMGVVLAQILVTTLVFQTIFHASGRVGTQNTLLRLVANTVNLALPSSSSPPSRPLATTPPKENRFLSMISPPLFLDPQKKQVFR